MRSTAGSASWTSSSAHGDGRGTTRARPARSGRARPRARGRTSSSRHSEAAIIEHDDLDSADAVRRPRSPTTPRPAATSTRRCGTTCTIAALGIPFERARFRELTTLSGGEQKRLALEALLRGPDEVLLLDEPDNYLDVPGKRWLEERLRETPKTVLLVSHDRELLARAADRIVTLEAGGGRQHGVGARRRLRARTTGPATSGWSASTSCAGAGTSSTRSSRRSWPTLKVKATANDGFASRYRAAQTRLRKFEEAGPPEERPPEQDLALRLRGARTGKRAVVAEQLELTGLMKPFDLEVWFGDRVAVLGSNGSGKSHFLRLLARGGTDPDAGSATSRRVGAGLDPVAAHRPRDPRRPRRAGLVRADPPSIPSSPGARCWTSCTAATTNRDGMPRDAASSALDRYGLVGQARAGRSTALSGGQQARFQILLLELSGATLLLLDEPTDNLDLVSAEALEDALARFEGTVLAVTHDRWFARSFDRFLVFGADGEVVRGRRAGVGRARVRAR